MIRHRITLPRPHVSRPEPALEMAMVLIIAIAVLAVGALGWSALTGRSLSPVSWYIARGSGFALYLLSWFLVLSGLGMTTKLLATTGNRAVTLSLHAFAFHLWYGLLALHVLSIAVDPAVRFGLVELVVPFASGWREPWTGLGIVAAQLGILTGASAAVRRVLGYRAWKALHWLSLPMFGLGLLHGLLAGTDGGTLAAFVLYVVTGGWVVMLGTYRVLRRHARDEQRAIRQHQAVLARGHGLRRPMRDV
jgi:methionine sulfoxide reductase heme-binding subunit